MKKLISLALVLAMVIGCVSMISFTANAADTKVLANGDCEAGKTADWDKFSGGTTDIVADPDDATNKVAKFTPTGRWDSIAYNMAAAVVDDTANGYVTGGAGYYKLSFRIKADLPSGVTSAAPSTLTLIDKSNHENFNKMFDAKPTVTNEWKDFSATIQLTAGDITKLTALASRFITFRLDFSNGTNAWTANAPLFNYYIDDVEFKYLGANQTGVQLNVDETIVPSSPEGEAFGYWRAAQGFFKQDMAGTDNKIKLSYDVYNIGTNDVDFLFRIQGGANSWSTKEEIKVKKTVPAGTKVNFVVEIPTDGNGKAAAGYLENVTLDKVAFRAEFVTKEAGSKVVVAAADADDILYKINGGAVNAASSGAVSMEPYFGELPAYGTPAPATATPTATAAPVTPTPVPAKKVENGDVENGEIGWGKFAAAGGTFSVATPGANGKGHAAKFLAAGKWDSIGFDLGAAIIQDAALNYKGQGAGTYTVTFMAKAEEGYEGAFVMDLNSNAHYLKGQKPISDGDYECISNTFINGGTIELTEDWEEYECTFEVTEEFLEMIKTIYGLGKTRAYELVLRFDGSNNAFADEEFFAYFVDDVKIVGPQGEGGGEEALPNGIEFEFKEEKDCGKEPYYAAIGGTGIVSAADVKDGTLKKTLWFANTGSETIQVQFMLQTVAKKADGKDTWAGASTPEYVTIEPGQKTAVTYECEVNEDGTITVLDADYALSTFFFRFNVLNEDGAGTILEGTKFRVYGTNADYNALIKNASGTLKNNATITDIIQSTGDMAPVAFIAVALVAVVALVVVSKKRRED